MSEPTKASTTAPATTTTAAPGTEVLEPRYSKRLKGAQKAERRLTKAHRRLSESVLAGVESWDRNQEKSAHKKKDGAVKDALENFTKAYAKSLRHASSVPRDVVKGVLEMYPKSVKKYFGL
ncbi:MAG: hypothetical protein U1E65_13315 [Myxococcota bacterium]